MVFKSADNGKTSGREGRDINGNAQKKETVQRVIFVSDFHEIKRH